MGGARIGGGGLDVQGREIWRGATRTLPAGRTRLAWDGSARGGPARPGLYLARVRVAGVTMVRRFVVLR